MPKNPQKCRGYEVFHRINYLFQAQELMVSNPTISTYYGNLIINVAKKAVLRIDPRLKRQICKRCRGPLLPGQTVNVKVKRKKKTTTVSRQCLQCKFIKKYPASNKKIWVENPSSLVEKIEYNQSPPFDNHELKASLENILINSDDTKNTCTIKEIK